MEPQNIFKYKLDFLNCLNKSKVNGVQLSDLKIFEKYNVWLFFQTRLFYGEIIPSEERVKNKKERTHIFNDLKVFTLGLFTLLFSLTASILFLIKRPRVVVYSVDKINSMDYKNDTRLDAIYRFLFKNKISFIEIFHTLWNKNIILYSWERKRFAIYLEAIDFCYLIFKSIKITHRTFNKNLNIDVSLFAANEKLFAEKLITKYVNNIDRSIFRVKVFSWILKLAKPRVIYAIDDARDYFELMLACKFCQIPFIAFQHGHFTKYNVAWFPSKDFSGVCVGPDSIYLWSEFWKKEMIRLGTNISDDSIKIGGMVNRISEIIKPIVRKSSTMKVLIPYEAHANTREVVEYVDKLLSYPNIRVIFKLRTDRTKQEQLAHYGFSNNHHPNLTVVYGDYDYESVDVIAGTYSTFLYDVIIKGIPVILLNTSIDFGEGLVKNGLADFAESPNKIFKVVNHSRDLPQSVLISRQKKLLGDSPVLLKDTLEMLANKYYLIK